MPRQILGIDGVAIRLRPRPFFQKASIHSSLSTRSGGQILLAEFFSPRTDLRSRNPALPPALQKTLPHWRFGLELPNVKILGKFPVVTITPLPIDQVGGFAYFARCSCARGLAHRTKTGSDANPTPSVQGG